MAFCPSSARLISETVLPGVSVWFLSLIFTKVIYTVAFVQILFTFQSEHGQVGPVHVYISPVGEWSSEVLQIMLMWIKVLGETWGFIVAAAGSLNMLGPMGSGTIRKCGLVGGSMSLCRQVLRAPSAQASSGAESSPLLAAFGSIRRTLRSFSSTMFAFMMSCFLPWQ